MAVKFYMLYCEICGYKRRTDGSDVKDMYEAKLSPIPTGVPKLNPQTKKIETPAPKKQMKRFRCPNCGRQIVPKRLYEPLPEVPVEEDPLGIELEIPGEQIPNGDNIAPRREGGIAGPEVS